MLHYHSTIPNTLNPYQVYTANNLNHLVLQLPEPPSHTEYQHQNAYPCQFCEQVFLHIPHLQDHISKQHIEEGFLYHTYNVPYCNALATCMCAMCVSSPNSHSTLSNQNQSYHTNQSPIHCNLCENVFYDIVSLVAYLRVVLSYNK